MNRITETAAPKAHRPEDAWRTLLAVSAISAAALLAYHNTFSVPFLFDDESSIRSNQSIRHLGSALWPPGDATVGGRPILNLSLAINYAVSGTAVWSYHVVNLAIHVFAGLVLFGIVRRTLLSRGGSSASLVAFCIALLWTLHPLQTESVTYLVQRAESLMGLFYLLTLYCFIRGSHSGEIRKGLWFCLCVFSCFLGMGTKEVMVTAPLIVLLYDRTFVGGSFHEAWTRRWRVYCGLAASWLMLPFLVLSTHGRGASAGFEVGVSSWSYALTQFPAIVHYLGLCFWPHGLTFYYGTFANTQFARILPDALIVSCLLAATAWALVRRPALGFLGACFFVILAPSSSIVPVATETIAEHRMYLPLIPLVVLAVCGMDRWLGRALLPVCLLLASALLGATVHRNRIYRSQESLWSDTVARSPDNDRARNNLGLALKRLPGRLPDAIGQFEAALVVNPDNAEVHNNLGSALTNVPGRLPDAIAQLEAALKINPFYAEAHNNLGNALASFPDRLPDAIAHFETALKIKPDDAEAHSNLGSALARSPGRLPDAIAQFEAALKIDPSNAKAHNNLGSVLANVPGRLPEAIAEFETALKIDPGYANAHYNLGVTYYGMPGRLPDAAAQFEAALESKPYDAEIHYRLGLAYSRMPGRLPDAISQFETALKINPDLAEARLELERALMEAASRS
jgi:protein O-mannosyl-transferase